MNLEKYTKKKMELEHDYKRGTKVLIITAIIILITYATILL
jgi:hypothetical protein